MLGTKRRCLMSDLLLKTFDAETPAELPDVQVGDSVTVYVQINVGERNERVQMVRGTVIRLRGSGNNRSFTVRRVAANGVGVERTFLLNSPRIDKIEVHRRAHVRRAQLYYLRTRTGKSARLKEKRTFAKK
jgi:large subunit ribosomal protein L19